MSWLETHPQSKRRFSLGGSAAPVEPEINLIPFIDVLLVVLIFLMISTTFTRYQELAITLPTANAKIVAGAKLLFVYTIEVDGSKISVSATKNGITSEILIDGVWQDMCENKYHCTIRIARGRFSSANTIQMGSEQTLQEISINCLPDICSGADDLYEFIVYTE